MSAKITNVIKHSIADRKKIKSGDTLVSINDKEIVDVLDFRFYEVNRILHLKLIDANDKPYEVKIHKPEYTELGLEFQSFLMDEEKSCKNKCIFCFIDQLPKGMRDTMYFKDDDSRLSFLTGNYITLTNMTEKDIDRIIEMNISPINVSVHTTNPELRCKMMNNRFAGESLKLLKKLDEAEVKMNAQIVLCKGINDGEELKKTLSDLGKMHKAIKSIAVVPVGLTKFREGLYPLTLFDKQSSIDVINIIKSYQDKFEKDINTRLVYPADEFYLNAGLPIPKVEEYEELSQLENGVGLMALLEDELKFALADTVKTKQKEPVTIVTGVLAEPFMKKMMDKIKEKQEIEVNVIAIKNKFFGETITVSGLVTGKDIIKQLKTTEHYKKVLIPKCMLRQQENVFLDDLTTEDIERELDIKVCAVSVEGQELLDNILG